MTITIAVVPVSAMLQDFNWPTLRLEIYIYSNDYTYITNYHIAAIPVLVPKAIAS